MAENKDGFKVAYTTFIDEDGNYVYTSNSIMNIKPFGYGNIENGAPEFSFQKFGALYYSRPKRCRTFFSLKAGIGHYRCSYEDSSRDKVGFCFSVRLVKNI